MRRSWVAETASYAGSMMGLQTVRVIRLAHVAARSSYAPQAREEAVRLSSKFPASSLPVIAADIQRGKKLTYDGALALLTLVASFAGA
jgi:hypothetical protein